MSPRTGCAIDPRLLLLRDTIRDDRGRGDAGNRTKDCRAVPRDGTSWKSNQRDREGSGQHERRKTSRILIKSDVQHDAPICPVQISRKQSCIGQGMTAMLALRTNVVVGHRLGGVGR